MIRPLLLAALAIALPASAASVKLDIVPFGVKLLSGKHARFDTVEVQTYVYNAAETTYVNRGSQPLLFLDVRIDTASARKHYLKPGDSLPATAGFFAKDTLAVLKAPFVVTAWADPLRSLAATPSISEYRISSLYFNLRPKVDTVVLAGCPPGQKPVGLPRAARMASQAGEATVYDVLGRPVWTGRLGPAEFPRHLPEGTYLLVQGPRARTFRMTRE